MPNVAVLGGKPDEPRGVANRRPALSRDEFRLPDLRQTADRITSGCQGLAQISANKRRRNLSYAAHLRKVITNSAPTAPAASADQSRMSHDRPKYGCVTSSSAPYANVTISTNPAMATGYFGAETISEAYRSAASTPYASTCSILSLMCVL